MLRFSALFLWCSFLLSLPFLSQSLHAQPLEKPTRLVTGRLGMPAVVVGENIYVIGGAGSGGYRSDIECINTQEKSLPVSVWKTKLIPRMFHTAEADGPYIYVLGGLIQDQNNEINFTSEVERIDTRDSTIKLMAPMPVQLRTPSSAIINQKIYVAGGSLMNGEWVDTLLIYDIESDSWKKGAPMPEKKECDLLPWHGGLLAVGGFNGQKAVAGVQSYDLTTDTWSVLPPLPNPTSAHHGAVVKDNEGNERVVLFGDYAQMTRVQVSDSNAGSWRSTNDSDFAPRRHTAVVAIGQKIYVIGGSVASLGSCLDDIQVFDAEKLLNP